LVATGMWRVELTLYTEVLPRLPVECRALSFSVHRTAADFILPDLFADGEMYKRLIFGLNAVMMVAYLAVTAWWMRRGAHKADEYLAFGFFMVLLFTPLLEINHLLWVTSAIILQLRGWLDGRIGPRGFAALAVGWGLFMALETLLAIPGQWKLPLQGYWLQTAALVYMTTVSGVVAFRGRGG